MYCPVPRLTSSPQLQGRICQITLPADMSAAGLQCDDGGWERGVSDGIWKWDNGSSAFPSVTLLWELVEGKGGGPCFHFNYERIPRRRQRGWWRGPPHNGHTPESRKLGHRSWRAGAKIPGAARRSPGRSPSRRPSLHLDPSRAVSACAAVISHNTLALLQTGSCRPLWRSVCDVGSRKRHHPACQ